ncbi:hypothetical protein [Chryseobacterium viscerum]|jgi:hypothetical protein|uniref:hypothetical protein n=1 Tax=Chryseobacterium TaxID=59732 RepID=UPI0022220E31|nr:hypothetical protein [Chryseobacterium viscerum]MCW1962297.1 hypothetical protein [Chryseobacterium viscerum]WPO88996.1 hypothetical protein SFA27_12225 [Chryseobacterium sp. HR92]
MKIILFPLLLISAALTAQKRDKLISFHKADTLKIQNKDLLKNFELTSTHHQKGLYKILIKKPSDTMVYLALQDPEKDYSQYKILNAITPNKIQMNPKKLIPSK